MTIQCPLENCRHNSKQECQYKNKLFFLKVRIEKGLSDEWFDTLQCMNYEDLNEADE